jgi:hypothetical protein
VSVNEDFGPTSVWPQARILSVSPEQFSVRCVLVSFLYGNQQPLALPSAKHPESISFWYVMLADRVCSKHPRKRSKSHALIVLAISMRRRSHSASMASFLRQSTLGAKEEQAEQLKLL